MKREMLYYINNEITKQAKGLVYLVKDIAPSTTIDLFNSTSLIIWSGASELTIYQDASINYMFRALHDSMHIKTGLDFSIKSEIELGKIQASKQTSDLMRELFYSEIVGQALYFEKNNKFIDNQVQFTLDYLYGTGFKVY